MSRPVHIIAPAFNEAANLPALAEMVGRLRADWPVELLVIDDGSSDDTVPTLERLAGQHDFLSWVSLSRNFGKEQAIAAGMINADPDRDVLLMDSDGQHDETAVRTLLAFADAHPDVDIVFGVRKNRSYQSRRARWETGAFYGVLNALSSIRISPERGDFFLARVQVASVLRGVQDTRLFYKGLHAWMGFHQADVPIEIAPRGEGVSSFSLTRRLILALDGLTTLTRRPLQMIAAAGIVTSFLSVLGGLVTVIQYLIYGITQPGYFTIVLLQMFFNGVILMAIGTVAQYVGNVHENASSRPPFLVARRGGAVAARTRAEAALGRTKSGAPG